MVKYYVYILKCMRVSKRSYGQVVYYTGMTSNPKRRLIEHKLGIRSNYMKQSKIVPIGYIHIEQFDTYEEAINREKQIKNYSLSEKLQLANSLK